MAAEDTATLLEGAEPTPADSSSEIEGSTDSTKDAGTNPADEQPDKPGKTSQDAASPDGPADKEPKAKDGMVTVPVGQHNRLKAERQEFKAFRDDMRDLGLESKEDVDHLRSKAARIDAVESQIANKPIDFMRDLQKVYPQSYDAILSAAMTTFLADEAKAMRGTSLEDKDARAQLIESLGDKLKGKNTPARETSSRESDSVTVERWRLFEERTNEMADAGLDKEISKQSAYSFTDDEQREEFFERVRAKVSDKLEANENFRSARNDLQHPSGGLDKQHSRKVADFYVRRATASDLLKDIVRKQASLMGLKAKPVNGSVATERKEVAGAGAAPGSLGGALDKDKFMTEAAKKGIRGKDLGLAWFAEKRKRALGA